jgi:Cyclophilin type peptidyl-prolyl cis-trans isomerase/CLD
MISSKCAIRSFVFEHSTHYAMAHVLMCMRILCAHMLNLLHVCVTCFALASSRSQFFFTYSKQAHLNNVYTVFGKVRADLGTSNHIQLHMRCACGITSVRHWRTITKSLLASCARTHTCGWPC